MRLLVGDKPRWFGQQTQLAVAEGAWCFPEGAIDDVLLRLGKHKRVVDKAHAALDVIERVLRVGSPSDLWDEEADAAPDVDADGSIA